MCHANHLNHTSARFDETVWTVVLGAAEHGNADAHASLERLCRIYWPPIYGFLRRDGQSPEDARDLTQGFFLHLLAADRKRLGAVQPALGKFRNWLLACLKNYLRNEWDKGQAKKRNPGEPLIHLPLSAEELGFWEPADNEDPALAFERHWATQLIARVLELLQEQCRREGKLRQFEALVPFLTGEAKPGGYAAAAASLQISEGAARVAATRLRQQYREILQTEVARTVADPAEIRAEITHLIAALRRP
jgi:RNA polymerase sigma-70 factor (ECF subfamily)